MSFEITFENNELARSFKLEILSFLELTDALFSL